MTVVFRYRRGATSDNVRSANEAYTASALLRYRRGATSDKGDLPKDHPPSYIGE